MPIKKRVLFRSRPGFSLTEMMMAVMISGMVLSSLAAIHATSTTHLFQNYRQNKIKNEASIAMKTVMSRLSGATRIERPAAGTAENWLYIAENVDHLPTRCYPIRAGEPVRWHLFCRYTSVNSFCRSGSCLMYHTGTIAGGPGCPNTATAPALPIPAFCGPGGGGTVTRLMDHISVSAAPIFSRRTADGIFERSSVRTRLHMLWTPPAGLNTTARPIDSVLQSVGSIQCNPGSPGC
ncbi:MAG: prepilin-type N-terminal cleavage/methylation domain-containing protein [Elusimicrobiales bacterium]|nr:prepilin-type N-terminal cleavage/methylation domain-containing protein [Elusimicrobiales bacterium]